jgi:hypothetical protein
MINGSTSDEGIATQRSRIKAKKLGTPKTVLAKVFLKKVTFSS